MISSHQDPDIDALSVSKQRSMHLLIGEMTLVPAILLRRRVLMHRALFRLVGTLVHNGQEEQAEVARQGCRSRGDETVWFVNGT